MEVRTNFAKSYVCSVDKSMDLLYGSETWSIWTDKDRIEASDAWYWIQLLRITWRDRNGNEDILRALRRDEHYRKT